MNITVELEAARDVLNEVLFLWLDAENPTCRYRQQAINCLSESLQALDASLANLRNSKE